MAPGGRTFEIIKEGHNILYHSAFAVAHTAGIGPKVVFRSGLPRENDDARSYLATTNLNPGDEGQVQRITTIFEGETNEPAMAYVISDDKNTELVISGTETGNLMLRMRTGSEWKENTEIARLGHQPTTGKNRSITAQWVGGPSRRVLVYFWSNNRLIECEGNIESEGSIEPEGDIEPEGNTGVDKTYHWATKVLDLPAEFQPLKSANLKLAVARVKDQVVLLFIGKNKALYQWRRPLDGTFWEAPKQIVAADDVGGQSPFAIAPLQLDAGGVGSRSDHLTTVHDQEAGVEDANYRALPLLDLALPVLDEKFAIAADFAIAFVDKHQAVHIQLGDNHTHRQRLGRVSVNPGTDHSPQPARSLGMTFERDTRTLTVYSLSSVHTENTLLTYSRVFHQVSPADYVNLDNLNKKVAQLLQARNTAVVPAHDGFEAYEALPMVEKFKAWTPDEEKFLNARDAWRDAIQEKHNAQTEAINAYNRVYNADWAPAEFEVKPVKTEARVLQVPNPPVHEAVAIAELGDHVNYVDRVDGVDTTNMFIVLPKVPGLHA